MYLDELRAFCLSLPEATEDLPFGPDVLAFRWRGKIFALADLDGESVNLKCEPERAVALREEHPEDVLPGYHMNKRHWNTVRLRGSRLPDSLIRDLIQHSHDLVANPSGKKGRAK